MTLWEFLPLAAIAWPLAFATGLGVGQLMGASGRTHVGKGTKGRTE